MIDGRGPVRWASWRDGDGAIEASGKSAGRHGGLRHWRAERIEAAPAQEVQGALTTGPDAPLPPLPELPRRPAPVPDRPAS